MDQEQTTGFSFGPFILDSEKLALLRHGAAVPLRPKAFDTLRLLLERRGAVLSKDDLVAAVWPDVIVNDDALSQCIRDVRRALEDDGQTYIRTIPRRGYSFVAEAVPLSGSAARTGRKRRRPLGTAVAGAVLAALGLAAVLLLRPDAPSEPFQGFAVAVLPFETAPGDEEDRWLGDGIAEDIMIELARFREIGVIDRSSSFRYAAAPDTIAALRDELGADYVLQGSVRLTGRDMRIALQLVGTASSTLVWAEHYNTTFDRILEIRNDILNQIAGRLAEEVQDAAGTLASAAAASDLSAWELVLRARRNYYRFDRDSAVAALDLVTRALELDPDYAAAWELLASLEFQFYIQPYDARRGSAAQLEAAVQAARKAVVLDPQFATGLAELGNLRSWAGHHEEGLADLRQAMALNPANAEIVRQYADVLSRAGQQKQALDAWARARALDPVVPPLSSALTARSHILLGDFEAAFALTSDCLRKAPRILPCHLFHIMAAGGTGDAEAVRASVAQVRDLAPRFTVSGWVNIIRFADQEESDTLSAYLVAAGLTP